MHFVGRGQWTKSNRSCVCDAQCSLLKFHDKTRENWRREYILAFQFGFNGRDFFLDGSCMQNSFDSMCRILAPTTSRSGSNSLIEGNGNILSPLFLTPRKIMTRKHSLLKSNDMVNMPMLTPHLIPSTLVEFALHLSRLRVQIRSNARLTGTSIYIVIRSLGSLFQLLTNPLLKSAI